MDPGTGIALVTGGARGIGRALVKELAISGSRVAFCYRQSEADAGSLVREVAEHGFEVFPFRVDVSDFGAVQALGKQIKERFGAVHTLVNNAGITRDSQLLMMKEEQWDAVINTNLKGAFNATKAVVYGMMKKRRGRILNISSVSGLIGQKGQTNYSASKAGLVGFTKALAKEVAPSGITVNALGLGLVETEMTDELSEQRRAEYLQSIPLGRFARCDEVAKIAVFLLSDVAGYITGQTIVVDGGLAI